MKRLLATLLAVEIACVAWACIPGISAGLPHEVVFRQYFVTAPLSLWRPTIHALENQSHAVYRAESYRPAATIEDALLLWRNRPTTVTIAPFEYDDGYTWGATDARGFRVTDATPASGDFRIVLMGGSTVYGTGANPGDTLAAKLQDALGATVINAGVGGYSSSQEFLYAVTEIIPRLHPDLIVVYDGWNDELLSGAPDASGLRSPRHDAISGVLNSPIPQAAQELRLMLGAAWGRTGIAFALGQARLGYIAALNLARAKLRPVSPYVPAYYPDAALAHRSNIENLMAVSTVPVAWFLQPVMGVDGKTYVGREADIAGTPQAKLSMAHRQRYYADIRPLLIGDCSADLSGVFAGNTERLYVDSGHLNASGNEIVAAAIAEHLRQCGAVLE